MNSFFNSNNAIITSMVQADNPTRVIELMNKSLSDGADAFGIQLERMLPNYRTPEVYKQLSDYAKSTNTPVYVTNYRIHQNQGKSDEVLAEELVELTKYGSFLCDVMCDLFDPTETEVTENPQAIKKQIEIINRIHKNGSKVLMSAHTHKFMNSEQVLNIALEQQKRGVDICKIVVEAESFEQQLECLKTITVLKQDLKIPFLFLCCNNCGLLRRVSGELGNCMYLCVPEYDEFATEAQPLIKDIKTIKSVIKI